MTTPTPPKEPPPKELPERFMRLCVAHEGGQEMWCDVPEADAAEACHIHTHHLLHPGNSGPVVAHGRFHSLDMGKARFVYAVPLPPPPSSGGYGGGAGYDDDDDDDDCCPCFACCD